MSATAHNSGKSGDLIVNIKEAREVQMGVGTTIRVLRYSEEAGS